MGRTANTRSLWRARTRQRTGGSQPTRMSRTSEERPSVRDTYVERQKGFPATSISISSAGRAAPPRGPIPPRLGQALRTSRYAALPSSEHCQTASSKTRASEAVPLAVLGPPEPPVETEYHADQSGTFMHGGIYLGNGGRKHRKKKGCSHPQMI